MLLLLCVSRQCGTGGWCTFIAEGQRTGGTQTEDTRNEENHNDREYRWCDREVMVLLTLYWYVVRDCEKSWRSVSMILLEAVYYL